MSSGRASGDARRPAPGASASPVQPLSIKSPRSSAQHARHPSVEDQLQDALSTSLPSVGGTSTSSRFEEPHAAVAEPPKALHASPMRRPHLLSAVSRNSIPVLGLVHLNSTASGLGIGISSHGGGSGLDGDVDRRRTSTSSVKGKGRPLLMQGQEADLLDIEQVRQSTGQRHSSDQARSSMDLSAIGDYLPSLNIPALPFTAPLPSFSNPFASKPTDKPQPRRPVMRKRSSSTGTLPRRQVQRTITSYMNVQPQLPAAPHLHRSPSQQTLAAVHISQPASPPTGFLSGIPRPSLPDLSMPSMNALAAPFSTSAKKSLDWKTWWEGPSKRDAMNVSEKGDAKRGQQMLKNEDKAGSDEDQAKKLESKCG